MGEHDGLFECLCHSNEDSSSEVDSDGEYVPQIGPDPMCPVTRHSGKVTRVTFSDDGAQVISSSEDGTVRVWDVDTSRTVSELTGTVFALVDGPSDADDRYVLTAFDYMLRIHKVGKGGDQRGSVAPVACFKAPRLIASVRCHGAVICVGCHAGLVLFLSAPFLTA